MADNVTVDNGTGTDYGVAADKVTYSGDADQSVQLFRPVHVTGAEGSKTVIDLSADGGLFVQGGVAHDAVDSGNPVKIGGKYVATPSSVAANDRVDGAFDSRGKIGAFIGARDNNVYATVAVHTDNESDAQPVLWSASRLMGYNGSGWDRVRTANTGRLQVDVVTAPISATAGDVAHDAIDSGNPVKIGGKARSSAPTVVANDDRVNGWFGRSGELVVGLGEQTNGGDGVIATAVVHPTNLSGGTAGGLAVMGYGYNGTTWDRVRVANTGRLQVDVVTGGGGGTQYVEDEALGAAGTGTLVLARRDDALSTLTPAEGDAVGLRTDSNGALWTRISTAGPLQVDISSNSTTDAFVVDGLVAHDAVDSGNPVKIGGKALSNPGTAVSESDRVDAWFTPQGALHVRPVTLTGTDALPVADTTADGVSAASNRLLTTSAPRVFNGTSWDRTRSIDGLAASDANTGILAVADVPHKVGYTWVNKVAQYTTTQTGAALWTPASGKRIVVTGLQIQAGATTGATIQVWFGASADTTYTRGTDIALFDGEFAPSSTSKPGVVMGYANGVIGMGTADHVLRVTTSAGMTVTVNVLGYEV